MTSLGLGLALGSGLLLLWWACWARPDDASDRRRPAWLAQWTIDVQAAGVSTAVVLAATAACALASALLLLTVTGVPALAACGAAIAGWLPVAVVRRRARLRHARLREVWPEVVDNLSSAVRAGLSLPEALAQLSVRGPEVLRPAFARFAHEYRATGRLSTALDVLQDELADPVGDRIVVAIRIARDTGGSDLGRLLRTLSGFLRQDARLRSELEGRQGWTVNAARLAVAAPWVVLLVLATRPESVAAYRSPSGALVLLVGAVVCLLSYRVMLWIARLPDERRVLR
jgi:tight adherence protein B